MSDSKSRVASITKGERFSKDQSPKNELEHQQMKSILYTSTVGSLMYAQAYIRPDIALAVGMLGRYQSNPGLGHWKDAKRVMRYFQGTKGYILSFKHIDSLEVFGCTDSDFAGCIGSRKSTSGYIFLLVGGVISWKSSKQTIVATSTMEAKSVACYEATTLALWLRNFIGGLKIVDSIARPIQIFYDNSAAVFFSKNNNSGSRSKHIDIKYLSVRDNIKKHEVFIEHISFESMVLDPMTKGLPVKQFKGHVDHMGLVDSFCTQF
jgi:hypothetical protein